MIVLDTDHVSVLLQTASPDAVALQRRLAEAGQDVATTIVTIEEIMRGWLAEVRRQSGLEKQIRAYERLQRLFFRFANSKVLPFDRPAADVYQNLKRQKVRVGAMDLKIAAIALSTGATLLTRNTVDFARIAGLQLEDWLS